MADQRKRLSELPSSTSTAGLYTLGVDAQNEGVKIPIGDLLNGLNTPIQQAKTAAQNAQQSASQAQTVASQAKTAADNATSVASSAKSTAETAASEASQAKSDAADAKNAAEAAKTAAEDASSTASETKTELLEIIRPRTFINANELLNSTTPMTLATVIGALSAHAQSSQFKKTGIVVTFMGEDGWESWQYIFFIKQGMTPPQFDTFVKTDYWRKFGGSAAVGNCFNVTNDAPLSMGYYDLETAIAVAWEKGFRNVGMQITFAIADKSWKTYQYIGADNDETAFKNTGNWLDNAGMSAGDETFIIIDALCGPCTASAYYTLEYAINALVAKSTASGIDYRKSGLVISFQKDENTWEAWQFTSSVGNFGEAGLWKPFGNGGGGSTVETKDEPEEDGTDAFSTGGAFTHIPTQILLDDSTEGVVKLALGNEAGQAIGEEKQFAVGTGTGGGQAGAILEITPETSPLYGQAGGTLIISAAITLKTGTEFENAIIERVELYDRDTEQLLETFRLNKATSADKETFDFTFDLSSYFTVAGQRKFRFVAYDDSDRTAKRNINVTAVDVTIKSEQTLHYTASTVLNVGGAVKQLPMYRFANNASDKGILCTTEIFIGGQWKTLGTATVSDTYAHSITIDPKNCCGGVLQHGAYPLRIHGEDISSGVVGNYLHTAVMVVDPANTTPLVVTRWYSEHQDGEVKQYETISIDFAVYDPKNVNAKAEIVETIGTDTDTKQTTVCNRQKTYTYTQRVSGLETDGSVSIQLTVQAADGEVESKTATFTVVGTLLEIESVTSQLMLDMDFAGRSNSDSDKRITDNGYELKVSGANYTTNGFVKDSFGTESYGTENDKGLMALRIAENVSAKLDYLPFNQAAVETNGMAVQFRFKAKHIADDDARLISCIANGFGFYVTGANVVFTTDNAETVSHTITAAIKEDSITDVAIVIEPASIAPYAGIGTVKMYFDGELIGTCYYDRGTLGRHNTPVTFNGAHGDLYLYNIRAWETYYSFEQSFNNYLLKLADTDSMISEYRFNQVMASQSAEGKPAVNRPQAAALYDMGIPYFVECKNADTADTADNYPDYLETLNGDKKTKRTYDIYFYDPNRPWQDFKAIGVTVTNQGTTSSMRPIKNIKMKFKGSQMSLLHDRSEFSTPEELAAYDECAKNIAKNRVQPMENSMPTNIITVKVDYSESGGAHNGASTQLFNELQRQLGANYMTPAQNAYMGKYMLNTSIDSVPCAFFRTDPHSSDATSPSYGYFHAKGNWNHDKGDAPVFGFEDVDGYNKGCLNYGDFIELIAGRNQTLTQFAASLDKSTWDAEEVYVLSEFCGPNHKVFRNFDGVWTETTGSMNYEGGRWRISGDVVNPVENYELLTYNGMDWFQDVKTVDDMIAVDSKGLPKWLTYFESRYPDNDDLNAAYEDGRKVPYRLFKWLEWCEQCNQNLTEADGTITIDGTSVSGTKANRLKKFQRELHKVANVHSMICYHVFTDYIAAVDQRSKNMMVGFYQETDGGVRMYLNHLYDGDTILGSDNDCGLTIPALLDPNNDPKGYYQGHDSVLFTQLANADYIWLKDYVADSDKNDTTRTVTVASIAAQMRSAQLKSGLRPFSPQGIEKYWITDRLSKWPKLVSSYDGIRKYIDYSTSNDNYFYALHGLSIQRLQDFTATRFLYRDGFYQCGDTYASAISMRCTGTNMTVKITAAKDGFFGIGVDQAQNARESVYLKAGETATLHSENTNLGSGIMLYLYGANCIGELDIRNATPKQSGWDISQLTLLKKLIIGGEDFTPATNNGDELNTLNLGQLPFLEELDVRNFPIKSIDAKFCPRLVTVLAEGSQLQSFTPAETSPISTLQLPDTMKDLTFVNLPNLVYPNGGLTIEGTANVTKLNLAGCKGIDTLAMLTAVVGGGAKIKGISVPNLEVTASPTILESLKASGAKGIGSDLDNACDGLTGRWILTALIPDSDFNALYSYFPTLELHNSQFTTVVFDDTMSDPANITNLENNTTGDNYTASGHIVRIREKMKPVYGKLENGVFKAHRLSDVDYRKTYTDEDFDYSDNTGVGNDTMMLLPHCWYKGINDFKTQKKYICWSSSKEEPISTATKSNRKTLSDIIYKTKRSILLENVIEGSTMIDDDEIMLEIADMNVYAIDVQEMKQVRWPGLNSEYTGGVFCDADGRIIKKFNMAVIHINFDFVQGEDYVFCDVPEGAVMFYFTSLAVCNNQYALAVDSSDIESMEPDWVESKASLVGIYEAFVDPWLLIRSLSDVNVRTGSGTQITSTEWMYDDNGNPKNTPLNAMNYTMKDFQNLARRRGDGYQLIDYEQSKFCAILWYSLNGTRNAQQVCGMGRGSGGTTGYADTIGNTDSYNGQVSGNKCLGIESFFACTYEWMDHIAFNVQSYAGFYKNKCVAFSNIDSVDYKFRIYDPVSKTERAVQASNTGGCIVRVRHGRMCDMIPIKTYSDTKYLTHYTDEANINGSIGRVVCRAHYNAFANGGLAYAVTHVASSYSHTHYGSRLAFRGAISVDGEEA